LREDILLVDPAGDRRIDLGRILGRLFLVFKFLCKFYRTVQYQGVILGSISIESVRNILFEKLEAEGFSRLDPSRSLLPYIKLDFTFDTRILNDAQAAKHKLFEIMKDIYWAVGDSHSPDAVLEAFVNRNRLTDGWTGK
jgi:hypothetical protein